MSCSSFRGPPPKTTGDANEEKKEIAGRERSKEIGDFCYFAILCIYEWAYDTFFQFLIFPFFWFETREEDLTSRLEAAMKNAPDTYAILVRRHGL